MNGFYLLMAVDFDTVVKVVIFLFVIISWIVGQAINSAKKSAPQQPNRPPRPANPPPQKPRQANPELSGEIEDFLRRVTQSRQGQPPREVEVIQTRSGESAVTAEVISAEVVPVPTLAKDVDTRFSSSSAAAASAEIAAQVDKLGDNVEVADDDLEAHLHSVFDHEVGSLGSETASPSSRKVPPSAAAEIASMLATPGGVRQAVILSEILNPPRDRWE